MKEQNTVIPIFFSIDDSYAPYLGVALLSMIQNASKENNYRVIVLYKELSQENQRKLKDLEEENWEVQFVDMEHRLDQITDRMSNRLRCDYFTLTIYFRLFIPVMFPEYDKGIYIDSDIVVPGDISDLYGMELGTNLIGASRDHSIQDIEPLIDYMNLAVGVGQEFYINSGVLLMNLKKLREVEFEKKFLYLLNKYNFDNVAPDQDYLNVMCYGNIFYLPQVWDAMPADTQKAVENPQLIHYNLFAKPWCYDNIQYEDYFWKYANQSVFLPEILENKKNYSTQQKQHDFSSLDLLLKKAEEIAHADTNFRTVFNEGKESRI